MGTSVSWDIYGAAAEAMGKREMNKQNSKHDDGGVAVVRDLRLVRFIGESCGNRPGRVGTS